MFELQPRCGLEARMGVGFGGVVTALTILSSRRMGSGGLSITIPGIPSRKSNRTSRTRELLHTYVVCSHMLT